jgi:hypothetical protein
VAGPARASMQAVKLAPYEGACGVPFSATREQLLRQRGAPLRQRRNAVGLNELDYGDTVFRFQDNGRLEEITAQAPVLAIGAVAIPFRALEAFLRAHDEALFERAGFLVSPAYGLAFAPGSAQWVTALAAHCLGEWRKL